MEYIVCVLLRALLLFFLLYISFHFISGLYMNREMLRSNCHSQYAYQKILLMFNFPFFFTFSRIEEAEIMCIHKFCSIFFLRCCCCCSVSMVHVISWKQRLTTSGNHSVSSIYLYYYFFSHSMTNSQSLYDCVIRHHIRYCSCCLNILNDAHFFTH